MGTTDAADAFRPADPEAQPQLSARDQEILAFERQWWKYAGAKEQAIRGCSTCRPPATTRCSTP